MLENINYIISAIIMIITSIIFSMILLEENKFKITFKSILMIVIAIILYSLGIKYLVGTIKTLFLCCIYIYLFRYLFKVSYYNAILLTFMYIVLIMIPDLIVLVVAILVLKIKPEIFYEEFAKTPLSSLVVCVLFIIMIYIFRKPLRKLMKVKLNISKEIIVYTILTLGCVLIIFYNATTDVKIISTSFVLSVIVMLIFVVTLYGLIKQKMEKDKVKEKYDKLLDFIKKYETVIEEQRMIRHEHKNQLITVKSKVSNNEDGQEIIKYVDSILKDHIIYREDKYGKFQYLPANGIKGLFYYKAMEAEEKGIKLSINIAKRVEKSILSKLCTEDFKQLGRLFGVYIDNAIEASSISKDKQLGIEVYMHQEDVIMIISNTYEGIIDADSVGKVRYSTKGNNRGHGLMLVNKILNGSTRFKAERTITEKLYIQKLIIKNNI